MLDRHKSTRVSGGRPEAPATFGNAAAIRVGGGGGSSDMIEIVLIPGSVVQFPVS